MKTFIARCGVCHRLGDCIRVEGLPVCKNCRNPESEGAVLHNAVYGPTYQGQGQPARWKALRGNCRGY